MIPNNGTYVLSVNGKLGGYELNLGITRSGVEKSKSTSKQIIFINMAGIQFSLAKFFNTKPEKIPAEEMRTISGLGSFMSKWKLNRKKQLEPLAKKIRNNIIKKLKTELSSKNPNLDVMIISDLGSTKRRNTIVKKLKDEKMPYSRLIIGGTREESLLQTIGIASTIDIGNFDLTDEAILLLDALSDESGVDSINSISIAKGAKKIDLVAEIIGNLGAHEIGHFLGNYHTENTNNTPSIMDEGGNVPSYAGILEGDAYGDKENVQVSFSKDAYDSSDLLLTGVNETDANTALALTSSKRFGKKSADGLIAFMNELNGIPTASAFPAISSYPNPQHLTETSTLTVNLEADSFLKVSLFDLQGRKISDLFTGDIKAGDPMELAITPAQYNLKSGVYLYKIISNAGQKSHKLIID